ncbi:MAG: chromate transporter, partial [Chitinophagaceae bacterium]
FIHQMYEQYVVRPESKRFQRTNPNAIKIEQDDFLIGAGFVRAIPGPVFSIGSFIGGLGLAPGGKKMQLMGCIIGTISIFLPSALLVLFFFPVWQNLQRFPVIFRSLKGINAAVVGIMAASTFYLINDLSLTSIFKGDSFMLMRLGVIILTFMLLSFTKISAPVITGLILLLGWVLN